MIPNHYFQLKFLKADIQGFDLIANFELDIKLSKNTVTVGDSVFSIKVLSHNAVHSFTVNTMLLYRKVKMKLYSGVKYSSELNSKLRSGSDCVVPNRLIICQWIFFWCWL